MNAYIGISLGYNTSAAVVGSRGVEFAISEERLTGEKNTKSFPINAIKACVEYLNLNDGFVTCTFGICSYETINERTLRYVPNATQYFNDLYKNNRVDMYDFLHHYIRYECNVDDNIKMVVKRVEHHEAHMLPVLYMSGFLEDKVNRTISITYDGFGDGVSGTIIDHKTGELLSRTSIDNSLALVYQYVTGALGFKEHQHEGKITGLAAFGKPLYVDYLKSNLIDYNLETKSFSNVYPEKINTSRFIHVPINNNIEGFSKMLALKEATYLLVEYFINKLDACKEDIAASVQYYVEELISVWICDKLKDNNIKRPNIVLSGGLFANVKINYRIKKVTNASRLFVLPPMGDEGTAIGAGMKVLFDRVGNNIETDWHIDQLYLGKKFGNGLTVPIDIDRYEILSPMRALDLIPSLLAKKKIVSISKGHSEFGPRALGNHSILFDASDKETNDMLNKKLGRTEFMPFAPITLDIFKEDLFLETDGLDKTLKYMTISVPVTDEFKNNYKAACHIDNTARPQILYKEDNTILYNIINKYYNMTKNKALVNTSFNLHNHPILFNQDDAYDSFVKADLDVLLLDDKLIVKKELIK